MNQKIEYLRTNLSAQKIDGMIITNPINIKYLTNIDAEGMLLITKRENIYITDGRYVEEANSIITLDDQIVVCDRRDISRYDYEAFFALSEEVGFEESHASYRAYKALMEKFQVNLIETDQIIEKQREIKDEIEIENIKRACEITDDCFSHMLSYIKVGMREREIAVEMERFMKLAGADNMAFDIIVASGENSSKPHSKITDRQIKAGDPILLDFGCSYNGYKSDMSRTIFVKFVPEEMKPIYDLVLKNQIKVQEEFKEGANAKIIVNLVSSDFKEKGFTLVHGLGHGVGLEIHELPKLTFHENNTLKTNMIVTNEPGIYIPHRFGVRIEDTVLVEANRGISLTKSDREYVIIKG